MPTYTTPVARCERVVRFLFGCARPSAASALQQTGFSDADFDEGWHLLRQAAGPRLPPARSVTVPEVDAVAALAAYEKQHYGVIEATLARRWPQLHGAVFLNLRPAEGVAAAVTVQVLLDRVEAMTGDDATHARAVLASRGFDAAAVAEGRRWLQALATLGTAGPDNARPDDDSEAADRAMWAWYLEWSRIVQARIRDPRALAALGFGRAGRPRGSQRR